MALTVQLLEGITLSISKYGPARRKPLTHLGSVDFSIGHFIFLVDNVAVLH